MKSLSKQEIFTYIALFVLLVIGIPFTDIISNFAHLLNSPILPSSMEYLGSIRDWEKSLYQNYSFILVGIVIILNRNNLKKLNVDFLFMIMFFWGGVYYCRFYFWPTGWMVALLLVFMIILSVKKEYKFGGLDSKMPWILLIIGILFCLSLLFIKNPFEYTKVRYALHSFVTEFPFIVVEEVVFRGMLWMFLKDLNWPELKIIISQAILFWLFHAFYIPSDPTFFWIIVPIISIFLGIVVWRTKSITASTIAHVLINVFLVLR